MRIILTLRLRVLLSIGTVLAACGSTRPTGRVGVVASFYPLAEVARAVAGEHGAVTNLTPAGAEPHDLELKPSQVATLQDAKVVLVMGNGFQPSVEKAARDRRGTVELLRRLPVADNRDPHVWLDPALMAEVVDVVRDALVRADPQHTDDYRANALRYRSSVTALDEEYRRGLSTCARHEIVTAHEAFGRLAARYGLVQRGIAGISPEAEPSPNKLAELSDIVRRDGVTTIFTETLVSPKIAQALAREAGVRTEVLDPIETLTKAETAAGEDYRSVMRANLGKLRAALGCT